MTNELTPEALDNIKPFSGAPDEMNRFVPEIGDRTLQRVQTHYTTAMKVQEPRSLSKVTNNVLAEARLAGSAFFYRWEVKSRKTGRMTPVQGPSIDLAMCIVRHYGNCALDIEFVETVSHFIFRGVFIDLETGVSVPRLFRQRKSQNIGGGYGDERAEDMIFQIGQSKAHRNAISKAVPNWLVDKAIEEAKAAEIADIKPDNIHIARAKVLNFFTTYGITQDRMEYKLQKIADTWTPADIVDLRGSATALKEGRISPDELFPPVPKEQEQEQQTTDEVIDAKSVTDKPKPELPKPEPKSKAKKTEKKDTNSVSLFEGPPDGPTEPDGPDTPWGFMRQVIRFKEELGGEDEFNKIWAKIGFKHPPEETPKEKRNLVLRTLSSAVDMALEKGEQ